MFLRTLSCVRKSTQTREKIMHKLALVLISFLPKSCFLIKNEPTLVVLESDIHRNVAIGIYLPL